MFGWQPVGLASPTTGFPRNCRARTPTGLRAVRRRDFQNTLLANCAGGRRLRSPARESITIDIFAMSDSLDFDKFPLAKHIGHDSTVAQSDSIAVLRTGKFLHAMGKGIYAE